MARTGAARLRHRTYAILVRMNERRRRRATAVVDSGAAMKTIGRRAPTRGGLLAAAPFLDLVIRLRGNKPFIPRGVHRFASFEESHAWSMKMMARPKRGRPA